MHKLHRYFEAKIAGHLKYLVTTGDKFFTKVYQRSYRMEVVSVDDDGVDFLVSSFDVSPSGMKSGGSDKGFGTVTIPFGESVEAMVKSAVTGADPTFFKEYPDVVGKAL